MTKARISKDETLTFLLTHLVIDQGKTLSLDQLALFQLTSLAQQAADRINNEEGVIPHEVVETLAAEFTSQ